MFVGKELASGGHQFYAPFGGLYTQCFPGREALYGPVRHQMALKNVSEGHALSIPCRPERRHSAIIHST